MSYDPKKEIEALKSAEKRAKGGKTKRPVNGQRNWGQTIAVLAALVIFWMLVLVAFSAGLAYSDQVRAFFAALFAS